MCSAPLSTADLRRQLRNDREQVADHEQVGELADRRVRILVDGHHVLGSLHADAMLNRAADATPDIERRLDHLSSLPDLELIRNPSGVSCRSAGPYRASQGCRQLVEGGESVRAADPAPT